jgi:DnaK suppressor protein
MTTRTKKDVPTEIDLRLGRRDELRRLLEERRRALETTLHDRIRTVRMGHESKEVTASPDDGEASGVDIQEDIELALIQVRAETLARIDESIERLEDGVYGECSTCGKEIASSRLRALPFAVRCRDCEERDESERRRARTRLSDPWRVA